VYVWLLVQVLRVPESVAQLSDLIVKAIHTCRSAQTAQDEQAGGRWRKRILVLVGFGRLAWEARRVLVREAHTKVAGPIHAAAMMAAPLFWVGLAGAMTFAGIVAALVPLVCLLHHVLAA
jgi:hypothetical protein